MLRPITNKIRCKFCGDIIESFTVHDFKRCRCGKCSTDGGHEYARRSFDGTNPEDVYEDLSTYIDTETNELLTPEQVKGHDLTERANDENTEPDLPATETIINDPPNSKVTEEQSDEPKKKPTKGRYEWNTGKAIKEE